MLITDIKQGKKDRERAHIYSDDKYIGTLYIDFIIKYDILINKDVSEEKLHDAFKESNNKRLFSLCVNYVLRRLRSEKEIREYMDKKIFTYKMNKEDVNMDEIIEKLGRYNYINDEIFAKAWTESRIHKGKGPQKIKMELAQKGIEKYIIEEVLNNIDESTKDSEIEKISEKYLRNKVFKNDSEKKWKLKQHLTSKGF